ncbi:Repressor of RNA polymerase III transcription MAF1 [Pleurostoma richardsiae]|uniref:Repressor of RNA polymerase III transcription MAF1 n=1 Tax=Pleurostoma richardsiae TaxID=41990 RepID=A0AA38VK96_9PEZI|nr:Repressor of RNA polymerase III transcription MAF1 [Pleurostoma richardsiae]
MKFLPLRDFDIVASALNFDTPDCHVTGGCDMYTTKAAGTDKKLMKNIDKSLESQHAALLKFGASLSPPQRESLSASLNLSRSSPFGNLSEISSRRTFAYLIATLNASHPDYDFSHVLRPSDFKREKSLRKVMMNLDSTLGSVRGPGASSLDAPLLPQGGGGGSYGSSAGAVEAAPAWGPHMWALIDKEMTLKDCTVFTYQPADDPFEEEAGAIWAFHHFFFNKALKRVAYLYARGVPVMSSVGSPRLLAGAAHLKRRAGTGLGGGGANKRAGFWLGDRYAERVIASDDEDDYSDGMVWNRDNDGELDEFAGDYGDDYDEVMDEDESDEDVEEDDDEDDDSGHNGRRGSSPSRGVSEDIAGRMEIE